MSIIWSSCPSACLPFRSSICWSSPNGFVRIEPVYFALKSFYMAFRRFSIFGYKNENCWLFYMAAIDIISQACFEAVGGIYSSIQLRTNWRNCIATQHFFIVLVDKNKIWIFSMMLLQIRRISLLSFILKLFDWQWFPGGSFMDVIILALGIEVEVS